MLYTNLMNSQYTWSVTACLRSSLISPNSTCRVAHSKDAHLRFISGWIIWHISSRTFFIYKKHLHLQRKQEVTKMVLYVKTSLGSYNHQRRYNMSSAMWCMQLYTIQSGDSVMCFLYYFNKFAPHCTTHAVQSSHYSGGVAPCTICMACTTISAL